MAQRNAGTARGGDAILGRAPVAPPVGAALVGVPHDDAEGLEGDQHDDEDHEDGRQELAIGGGVLLDPEGELDVEREQNDLRYAR